MQTFSRNPIFIIIIVTCHLEERMQKHYHSDQTYRSDHAVVLFVSTTAPQETNKTDNYSNDNQKHWTCGQVTSTNVSEVTILGLDPSTNGN